MFNDILTGKSSLEPKPAPMAPYREQGVVPPVQETCVGCGRTFPAPANTIATHCQSCLLSIRELNAQNERVAFMAAEDEARRANNSHRLFAIIGGIVVVVGLGIFKFGMRSQMREDAAIGAGYSSYDDYKRDSERVYATDEYSSEVHSIASEMCFCKDLKCARDVQSKFINYSRSHAPSDDMAEKYARQESIRLADCQAAIEAGGTPAP